MSDEIIQKCRIDAYSNILKAADAITRKPIPVYVGKQVLVGLYSRSREANKLPLFCSPAIIQKVVENNRVVVSWLYDTPNRPKNSTKVVPVSWCRELLPLYDIVESIKQNKNVYRDIEFEDEDNQLPEQRYFVEKVVAKGLFDDACMNNQYAVLIKWNGWEYAACTWESFGELYENDCLADQDLEVWYIMMQLK